MKEAAQRSQGDHYHTGSTGITESPNYLSRADAGYVVRASNNISNRRATPRPRKDRHTDDQSRGRVTNGNLNRCIHKPMMSSIVFVVSALETIAASKEAHKNKPLSESVQKALKDIKEHAPQLPDPEVIFAPLQLATKTGNSIPLITTALDCIGKLISYSYFSVPSSPNADKEASREPLIDRAINTICDCFQGETTPVEIQLQIVKSLLAAVLNDKIVVHGAGLLKAVRQVYNVFLLSKSSANQQVAQGTLTQMVGTVFERVKTRIHMKEARLNLGKLGKSGGNTSSYTVDASPETNGDNEREESVEESVASEVPSDGDGPKLTLKDLEHRKSFDDSQMGDGSTMVTQLKHAQPSPRYAEGETPPESTIDEGMDSEDNEDEVYIRDAYLVFRSFCNLSTKVLPPDQLYDLKGQAMRSKLISLHLIHTLLNNNMLVFTSPLCTITNSKSNEPTGFLQAIKFYLCLSITRNGASSVDRVFEVCCEIFWLMLKFMRAPFKVCLINPLKFSALILRRKRLRFFSMRSTWRSWKEGMPLLRRNFISWEFSRDTAEIQELWSRLT